MTAGGRLTPERRSLSQCNYSRAGGKNGGGLPKRDGCGKRRWMNRGEKILIAEDEADVQELVSLHLRNAGFVPVNAENGPEAIRRAREDLPSLIVLDIMLAGMNGLEVCKLLKADTKTSGIPLIMLTAKA